MVVGREIPAPGVDDKAVRAQLPPRLLARERSVRAPNPPPPPDDVREEKHGVAPHRRDLARSRGEVERRLERLHAPPQTVRQDAADLQECALGRLRRPGQPEPSRRLDSERDGHRLVVREHERRQPVAGTDAVPTPDTALPLHRDAELLQRADIATDRARVDLEPIRDLTTREQRLRLEQLEQLQESGRRGEHARSQAQIEGGIRPI